MPKLYCPTVGDLKKELQKFKESDTIWFECGGVQCTPIGICGQKGYTLRIEEGSYRNNVYIEVEKDKY